MKKIKQWLRNSRKKSFFMLWLWNEWRRNREKGYAKKYTDEEFIKKAFKSNYGFEPNLENPKRFNEKMCWLKLHYRTPLHTKCADKYGVREYVKECGYEHLLNELVGIWDNVNDININELPNKFVFKATHGSAWNVICKDKSKFKFKKWKPIMKSWLKQNPFYSGREWPYKNIKPRIICEKFLDANGDDLRDYKIFCFNGEPKYIQVDGERFTNLQRAFYDTNWIKQDIQCCGLPKDYTADKPKSLEQMLEIAKKLSAPFPFARVDLYNFGETIIFGEITFYPDCGLCVYDPDEVDFIWGEMVELPEPTY